MYCPRLSPRQFRPYKVGYMPVPPVGWGWLCPNSNQNDFGTPIYAGLESSDDGRSMTKTIASQISNCENLNTWSTSNQSVPIVTRSDCTRYVGTMNPQVFPPRLEQIVAIVSRDFVPFEVGMCKIDALVTPTLTSSMPYGMLCKSDKDRYTRLEIFDVERFTFWIILETLQSVKKGTVFFNQVVVEFEPEFCILWNRSHDSISA
mmetsp:Transcript_3712/g.8980  ORF Transcript_3712/g.8980 Transcript_3712/m.8980 type:complete len:204 (+) Transcript_3712:189-800(+)